MTVAPTVDDDGNGNDWMQVDEAEDEYAAAILSGTAAGCPTVGTCPYRVGKVMPPVLLNTQTCFAAHGIRVHDYIGEGANGSAYYSCLYDNCDCILKLGHINESEYRIAHIMGEMGVGPRIYYRATCPFRVATETPAPQYSTLLPGTYSQQQRQQLQLPEAMDVLVMQRLSMTLEQWLQTGSPLTAAHAHDLHNLIAHAHQLGLLHLDLKSDNIMVELGTDPATGVPYIERFYLIDFGWSYYAPLHGTYNPYLHKCWCETVPVSATSSVGQAWDEMCVFADLQLLHFHPTQTEEFMNALAHILTTQYGVPDTAFAQMKIFLRRILPANGYAVRVVFDAKQ